MCLNSHALRDEPKSQWLQACRRHNVPCQPKLVRVVADSAVMGVSRGIHHGVRVDGGVRVCDSNLRDGALAGFSMGGGEVARYLGKYGSERVRMAVFIAGIPPFLLKAADNPSGVDSSVFEGIQQAIAADRPAFLSAFLEKFYNYRRPGRKARQRPGRSAQLERRRRRLREGHPRLRLGVADRLPQGHFAHRSADPDHSRRTRFSLSPLRRCRCPSSSREPASRWWRVGRTA